MTVRRYGITYTGQWATTENRIFVHWNLQEDSALLGMFDKDPETLARIRYRQEFSVSQVTRHHL